MRSTKELLEILLKKIQEDCFRFEGMCLLIHDMTNQITYEERAI